VGRPRKNKAEQMLDRITVRFTHEETQLLRNQAAAAGLTVAEVIRRRSLGQRVQPLPRRVDVALVNELNRIGVNVNQLAFAMHTERDFVRYWQEIGTELEAVLQKVLERYGS
jgi:predicted hydrolase (HD superfamily)